MVQFCYKGLYLGIENVCLSFVAADGKDGGHGLKRECYARNNHPNNIVVSAPWWNSFDIFSQLFRSILYMGKGAKWWLLHRLT